MFVNVSKNKNASQIIQYLKKYTSYEFQNSSSVVGLVYESHFLDLSEEAKNELEKIIFPDNAYIFVLEISKGVQGNSLATLYDFFQAKGIEISFMEHIILGEDLHSEASFMGEKKSTEAEHKIQNIAKELEEKVVRKVEFKKSYLISVFASIIRIPWIYSFLVKSLDSNRCNKCGHCRGVCPTQKKISR